MDESNPVGITYDTIESIRKDAFTKNRSAEALHAVTQKLGDPDLASIMLMGPEHNPDHISYLNDHYSDPEVRKAFDQTYGIGAAEKYKSPGAMGYVRDIVTAPDKALQGIKTGVAQFATAAASGVAKMFPENETAKAIADISDHSYKLLSEKNSGETWVGKSAEGAGKMVGHYVLPAAEAISTSAVQKGLAFAKVPGYVSIPVTEGVMNFFGNNPTEDNTGVAGLWELMAGKPESPAVKSIYEAISVDPNAPDYQSRLKMAADAVGMLGVASGAVYALAKSISFGRERMSGLLTKAKEYITSHGVPGSTAFPIQFDREELKAARAGRIIQDGTVFPWENAKANLGRSDLMSATDVQRYMTDIEKDAAIEGRMIQRGQEIPGATDAAGLVKEDFMNGTQLNQFLSDAAALGQHIQAGHAIPGATEAAGMVKQDFMTQGQLGKFLDDAAAFGRVIQQEMTSPGMTRADIFTEGQLNKYLADLAEVGRRIQEVAGKPEGWNLGDLLSSKEFKQLTEEIAAFGQHIQEGHGIPGATDATNIGKNGLLSAREIKAGEANAAAEGRAIQKGEEIPGGTPSTGITKEKLLGTPEARYQEERKYVRQIAHYFPEGTAVRAYVPMNITKDMVMTSEGLMSEANAVGKKILDNYLVIDPHELNGKLGQDTLNDVLNLSSKGLDGSPPFRLFELLDEHSVNSVLDSLSKDGFGAGVMRKAMADELPHIEKFIHADDWKGLFEYVINHNGTELSKDGKIAATYMAREAAEKQFNRIAELYRSMPRDVISPEMVNALDRLLVMRTNLKALYDHTASNAGGTLNLLKMLKNGKLGEVGVDISSQFVKEAELFRQHLKTTNGTYKPLTEKQANRQLAIVEKEQAALGKAIQEFVGDFKGGLSKEQILTATQVSRIEKVQAALGRYIQSIDSPEVRMILKSDIATAHQAEAQIKAAEDLQAAFGRATQAEAGSAKYKPMSAAEEAAQNADQAGFGRVVQGPEAYGRTTPMSAAQVAKQQALEEAVGRAIQYDGSGYGRMTPMSSAQVKATLNRINKIAAEEGRIIQKGVKIPGASDTADLTKRDLLTGAEVKQQERIAARDGAAIQEGQGIPGAVEGTGLKKEDFLKASEISDIDDFRNGLLGSLNQKGIEFRAAQDMVEVFSKELEAIGFNLTEFQRNLKKMTGEVAIPNEDRSAWQKVSDMIMTERYGALMANWKTHETNILSSMAHIFSRTGSELLFGDSQTRALALSKFAGMIDGAWISAKIGVNAGLKEHSYLSAGSHNPNHNYRGFSTEHLFGKSASEFDGVLQKGGAYALNSVGHVIRSTTRLILASDEFMKQLVARGEVHAQAEMQGRLLGHTGEELDAFIQNELKDAFTHEGVGLNPLAVAKAEDATFNMKLNRDSKYLFERMAAAGGTLANHPIMKFLATPFYNTVVQIMRVGTRTADFWTPMMEKLPGGRYLTPNQRYFDDLRGLNGASRQAVARGSATMCYSMGAAAVMATLDGTMTGAAPKKIWDAKLQRDIDVPPFHKKIGDKWYNYGQYEPLATPLKLWASAAEGYLHYQERNASGEYENWQEAATDAFHSAFWAMMTLNTSNPFNQGIDNIIKLFRQEQPEDIGGEFLKQQWDASIPSVAKHYNVQQHDGAKFDPKGFWQSAVSSLPWVSDSVPIGLKRNLLGEIQHEDVGHRYTNMIGVTPTNDPVLGALYDATRATKATFKTPSSTSFYPGKDLKTQETIGNDGKKTTMYDKYLDTFANVEDPHTGLTARESLTRLLNGDRFLEEKYGVSRASGGRTDMLQKVISAYHGLARDHLESVDPSFKALLNETTERTINQYNPKWNVLK